jgi:pyridoxal phosphate enzyme (YggS family)
MEAAVENATGTPGGEPGHGASPGARRAEIEAGLQRVRKRIEAAAAASAVPVPELIVVTKFFPASDVRLLAGLGVRQVGENRDQEAAPKAAEVAELGLQWHFIGQLQTNKAKSVVRYATAIHSVDRPQLAAALDKAMARENERLVAAGEPERAPLRALIQVDLRTTAQLAAAGGAAGRGGAVPQDVPALAEAIASASGLELAGVMAVAPLGGDPAEAFARLAEISGALTRAHPDAGWISAGMSGDLEQAVAAGATHLRVGSDVLGPRPALR